MKIALITGASRGLGRSTAQHLSRAGWGVIGTYRTSKHEADTLTKEIQAAGGSAVMLHLDTGITANFAAFADSVGTALNETFGREHLDALVNNAGTSLFAPFAETTEEQFDELVDNQLRGPFFLTQRMLPSPRRGSSWMPRTVRSSSSGIPTAER